MLAKDLTRGLKGWHKELLLGNSDLQVCQGLFGAVLEILGQFLVAIFLFKIVVEAIKLILLAKFNLVL